MRAIALKDDVTNLPRQEFNFDETIEQKKAAKIRERKETLKRSMIRSVSSD